MKQKYVDFLKEVRGSDEYWAESTISDFTEELCRLMEAKGITRGELAEKIHAKPSYITKILKGNANFTLVSMTKLARALGTIVRVHLASPNVSVNWTDVPVQDSHVKISTSGFGNWKIATQARGVYIVGPSRSELVADTGHLGVYRNVERSNNDRIVANG